MKKIKKFLPIEFYFIFIPSIFIFLFSFFYLKNLSIDTFGIKTFLGDFFADIALWAIPLLIILSVLFFGFFYELFFCLIAVIESFPHTKKKRGAGSKLTTTNWRHILSIFLIIILFSFATYSFTLFTGLLFKIASPLKTAIFGNIALSWDKAIFKTYPGIWLINKFGGTFLETIFLWTYNSLFPMISLLLVVSFFFNKKAFRKLVLSFFISWIIAFPIWFMFPTLSPDFMFRLNSLNMAGSQQITAFNNFNPTTQLKKSLTSYEREHLIDTNPSERILPTSTFPSMHAAWGVIAAYAGIIISPWIGLILVPWAILNGIGAVYVS